MSTGNVTDDQQSFAMNTWPSAGGKVGRYTRRSWSGLNGADNFVNPYECTVLNRFQELSSVRYRNSSGSFEDTRPAVLAGSYLSSDLPSFPADKQNAMINRLYSKIRDVDFNALVSIAEGARALDMIGDRAYQLYKAYSAARRFDVAGLSQALGIGRTKGRKVPTFDLSLISKTRPPRVPRLNPEKAKALSDLWLEYQYGWRPLIADIFNAAEDLPKAYSNKDLKVDVRVRGSHETRNSVPNARFVGIPTSSIGLWLTDNCVAIKRIQYVARIHGSIRVAETTGVLNPASVAWELVPFSFIVDWILPIGDYIANLGTASLASGSELCMTTTEIRRCVGVSPRPNGTSDVSVSALGNSFSEQKTISRIKGSLPMVPFPAIKGLNTTTAWQKAFTVLALFRQRL